MDHSKRAKKKRLEAQSPKKQTEQYLMGLQNKKQKTEGSINSATRAANRKRNPMKLDKNQKMGPQPILPHPSTHFYAHPYNLQRALSSRDTTRSTLHLPICTS